MPFLLRFLPTANRPSTALLGALLALLMMGLPLPGAPSLQAAPYTLDPAQTTVQFHVEFLAFRSVTGTFHTVQGSAEISDGRLQAVEATIQTTSVDTGKGNRDEHLRTDHFFDTAAHPTIAFQSTQVNPLGNDRYRVTGDLTIRGITKQVDLEGHLKPSTAGAGPQRYLFEAEGLINRHDWQVSWNQHASGRDLAIGDEVRLELKGEVVATGG